MDSKQLKVGLCSFGLSGRVFHAPLIDHLPSFELSLILERTKELSKVQYPNAKIVRSLEAILDSDVDLIVVNGPSNLHYDWTKRALEAGKHVIVEKPFVAVFEEGLDLITLAEQKSLLLSVYQNKRFESDYRTIERLFKDKVLGTFKKVEIRAHRFRPEIGLKKWKENDFPAAGLLYDIGSHLIDQTLSIFGKAKSVEGEVAIQRKGGIVDDFFNVIFKYEDFSVQLIGDMLTNEVKPTIRIEGDKGVFVKYGRDPQEVQLAQYPIDWECLGVEEEEIAGEIEFLSGEKKKIRSERGDYLDYYRAIYDCLTSKGLNPVFPKDALEVIQIIEKIKYGR